MACQTCLRWVTCSCAGSSDAPHSKYGKVAAAFCVTSALLRAVQLLNVAPVGELICGVGLLIDGCPLQRRHVFLESAIYTGFLVLLPFTPLLFTVIVPPLVAAVAWTLLFPEDDADKRTTKSLTVFCVMCVASAGCLPLRGTAPSSDIQAWRGMMDAWILSLSVVVWSETLSGAQSAFRWVKYVRAATIGKVLRSLFVQTGLVFAIKLHDDGDSGATEWETEFATVPQYVGSISLLVASLMLYFYANVPLFLMAAMSLDVFTAAQFLQQDVGVWLPLRCKYDVSLVVGNEGFHWIMRHASDAVESVCERFNWRFFVATPENREVCAKVVVFVLWRVITMFAVSCVVPPLIIACLAAGLYGSLVVCSLSNGLLGRGFVSMATLSFVLVFALLSSLDPEGLLGAWLQFSYALTSYALSLGILVVSNSRITCSSSSSASADKSNERSATIVEKRSLPKRRKFGK